MKTILLFIALLSVHLTQAQTILYESFGYGGTAGPFCGTGGVTSVWTPHLNSGSTPVLYTSTSLTYVGYGPGSSIGNGAVTFVNGATPRENINRTLPLANSGTVYISFLLKVAGASSTTVTSDYVLHFNDTFGSSLTSNAVGRIFVKNQMLLPYYNLGLSKGSLAAAAVYSPINYSVNSTVLVVMKYVFNTASGTDDNVYAWIFTSGVPVTEPVPQLTATDMTVNDLTQIRSVCIRQGTVGTSNGTIDMIKVGLTWPTTVLPVKWLDFSAQLLNEGLVSINWKTASEINNDYFEVERAIETQREEENSWIAIGKVKGNGNTNSVCKYTFSDNIRSLPFYGSNIKYRIKQVDFDGNVQYSKIVSVDLEKEMEANVGIYPNPFKDELIIRRNSNIPAETKVEIFDLFGKKIYGENLTMTTFESQIKINLNAIPAKSVYTLKIDDKIYRLVKE